MKERAKLEISSCYHFYHLTTYACYAWDSGFVGYVCLSSDCAMNDKDKSFRQAIR